MKYTTKVLKQLLMDHGIETGATNKTELVLTALDNGILKREDIFHESKHTKEPIEKRKVGRPRKFPPKEIDQNKVLNPKYERLLTIRNNPKKIKLTNIETGEVSSYESINKSVAASGHAHRLFSKNDGKIVNGITIETE